MGGGPSSWEGRFRAGTGDGNGESMNILSAILGGREGVVRDRLANGLVGVMNGEVWMTTGVVTGSISSAVSNSVVVSEVGQGGVSAVSCAIDSDFRLSRVY